MRYLLMTFAGLVFGAALIVAVAVAGTRTTTVTVNPTPATSAMPMGGGTGSMMMSAASTPAISKLTIQHVQRGCHVWSNGTATAAMMRLHLKPGQRLTILDMDVDAHQMLQFAGPARLRMGGPMSMSHSRTLSFPKAGVYRLGTKTVEMPGGMEVKTTGPDNNLRLVVTVA